MNYAISYVLNAKSPIYPETSFTNLSIYFDDKNPFLSTSICSKSLSTVAAIASYIICC